MIVELCDICEKRFDEHDIRYKIRVSVFQPSCKDFETTMCASCSGMNALVIKNFMGDAYIGMERTDGK